MAGQLLSVVQHWAVFLACPELFVLVPALLGLKGNLEMTLASRLATSANMGKEMMQKVGPDRNWHHGQIFFSNLSFTYHFWR